MDPRDRVGVLLGDLLDLDAALRREHPEVLLRGAVERERRVVLLGDVARLLDPQRLDDVALDVHAEDVRRRACGTSSALAASLMPPALPAPADLHLRLDHDRVADAVGRRDGLVDGVTRLAGRHRDAVAREELLALVLEQVHLGSWSGPGSARIAGTSDRSARRAAPPASSRAARASR